MPVVGDRFNRVMTGTSRRACMRAMRRDVGLRDPAFYERDTFYVDRVEVLRGSASMLFGRGSTGGALRRDGAGPRRRRLDAVGTLHSSGSRQSARFDDGAVPGGGGGFGAGR